MINLDFTVKKAIGLDFVFQKTEVASVFGRKKLAGLAAYSRDQKAQLLTEFDNLEKLLNSYDRYTAEYNKVSCIMARFKELQGTLSRLVNGLLDVVELYELKCFFLNCGEIKEIFDRINAEVALSDLGFADFSAAFELLDPNHSRTASFSIYDVYSEKLAGIRRDKNLLAKCLCKGDEDARQRHLMLAAEEAEEEQAVCALLTNKLRGYAEDIKGNIEMLACLDLLLAKCRLARQFCLNKPVISERVVEFRQMFNPWVAEQLTARDFTPLDIRLDCGATLLTGVNMGGKSVAQKTLLLNVILVNMGFYSFAAESVVPIFDFIEYNESEFDGERNLSGFGVEVMRLDRAYKQAKQGFGLIVLDEFASTTNATEGKKIFSAAARSLDGLRCITLMTSHYDDVSQCFSKHYQVCGLTKMPPITAISERGVDAIAKYMDYGLVEVKDKTAPQDAVTVCRLLSLDEDILKNI